jgi:hypothetical protein
MTGVGHRPPSQSAQANGCHGWSRAAARTGYQAYDLPHSATRRFRPGLDGRAIPRWNPGSRLAPTARLLAVRQPAGGQERRGEGRKGAPARAVVGAARWSTGAIGLRRSRRAGRNERNLALCLPISQARPLGVGFCSALFLQWRAFDARRSRAGRRWLITKLSTAPQRVTEL